MKLTIVSPVEGVLRKTLDKQPIKEAIALFQFLKDNYFVLLTEDEASETEEWLAQQNIPHDLILGRESDRIDQMHKIEHEWGYKVSFVIEPDPVVCARLVEAGYTVLGFFHPNYAKAEWRPGFHSDVRPWDDVVAQVVSDNAKRRADERLGDE